MVNRSREILIRGLEPGSAYLAYLLSKSGHLVTIQTNRVSDVYLYDVPPAEVFLKSKFLKDVMLVDFVSSADAQDFGVVVDSCDLVGVEDVVAAYKRSDAVVVRGDPWLSATLSLSRGLPVPNAVDLPVEKTDKYAEISLEFLKQEGGSYSLCDAVDALSGERYTPLRTLERVYLAVDVFKEIEGRGAKAKQIRLEYALGRGEFFAAFGARPSGKISRVSAGGTVASIYGSGGELKYIFLRAPLGRLQWALALYNALRLDSLFYLYDVGPARSSVNIAGTAHLLRSLRRLRKKI